jgi:hypothetical protein
MKISKIVTCASLALCFTLGAADSFFPARLAVADADSDRIRARGLVEDAQDAIARLERLTKEELEANPDLLRDAHHLAEDARAALLRARTSLANEFGRTIHREQAIQINLALMSSEATLRNAMRNLPALPTPDAKDGKMSPERAVEVLNRDVEILTTLHERSHALYGDDNARATLQAAFDKLGTGFPHSDAWGDSIYMSTHDPLGRLWASIQIIRRQAASIARFPNKMNADYVVHLHDAALRLGREHKAFMETAASIVDNLAHQGKSMHDDNNDGEFGNPNPELEKLRKEMKPLNEAIKDRNLLRRPMEADEWAKKEAAEKMKNEK